MNLDDPGLAALPPLAAAWAACLGAVVGSFLNVVIARLPRGESVVRPRSRCPRCGAAIAWYDNVPVLSWILLRARCRACRAPISWRYPLVEALAAGAALAAFFRHGLGAAFAAEPVPRPGRQGGARAEGLHQWVAPGDASAAGAAAGAKQDP